jgi:hypothetical protein
MTAKNNAFRKKKLNLQDRQHDTSSLAAVVDILAHTFIRSTGGCAIIRREEEVENLIVAFSFKNRAEEENIL